jgi:ankyrin repeat protein
MKHLLLTTIAAVLLVGCGNPEAVCALLKAATEGNIEGTKQLIADGADVNAKNRDGTIPLHTAAARGHKELLQLLIANSADVNAKNEDGLTPLHGAAVGNSSNYLGSGGRYGMGHKEIAELLLAEGADVNAKDVDVTTPLDLATLFNQPETAELLRKHGGKTGEELKAEGKYPSKLYRSAIPVQRLDRIS